MTSWWARWCLKSSTSPLFTQLFQVQIKETIIALRHWPGRWPVNSLHKRRVTRKMFDEVIIGRVYPFVYFYVKGNFRSYKITCKILWIPFITDRHPRSFLLKCNDGVIKWKHFPRNWPFVRGIHRSPVNSPHKGQWRGALMFFFICVWINDWVNNREVGDLRRYRAHYDVTVM